MAQARKRSHNNMADYRTDYGDLEALRRAFREAWAKGERANWILGRLGRINPDASVTIAVESRPGWVYVRRGSQGTDGLVVARNVGASMDAHLPVRMRKDGDSLVVEGVDWSGRRYDEVTLSLPPGGGGGTTLHALDGALHSGTLGDYQAPQFLLRNGTRSLTGNLAVDSGITVDGIDISAHAANVNAHHARDHALIGSTHTASGLTTGQVLRATSTTAFAFQPLAHTDLTGVTANQHHDQVHGIVGSDHTATGSQYQLVGLTGANTLGLLTPSANPGASAAILRTQTDGTTQLRILASNVAFFSGFAGSGYRVDYGITEAGKASAEFDNLTIRGRMRVYELLIQQIRATNGSVIVSSASTAEQVASESNLWTINGAQLTFNGSNANFNALFYRIQTRADVDDDSRNLYHGFLTGDVIRAQRFQMDINGGFASVRQSNLRVGAIYSLWEYAAHWVSGDAPIVGDDFVRLGSDRDTTRQGALYLTADDSNAPFMDVVDGIRTHADWNTPGKIRVRVGKLTGITDSDFGGTLTGYGLYGDNVYLKGKIVVTGGNAATTTDIAGRVPVGGAATDINANTTTIDGGRITANTVTAAQILAGTITANEIAANTITSNKLSVTSLSAITANMGALNIDGVLSVGTSGGIYQGTGTFASPTTGLKVWNDSGMGRIAGYNSGIVQWYAGTDGRLYAGGGGVRLGATGVDIEVTSTPSASLAFTEGLGNLKSAIYGYRNLLNTVNALLISAEDPGRSNLLQVTSASKNSGQPYAEASIGANGLAWGSAVADTVYASNGASTSNITHRATDHYINDAGGKRLATFSALGNSVYTEAATTTLDSIAYGSGAGGVVGWTARGSASSPSQIPAGTLIAAYGARGRTNAGDWGVGNQGLIGIYAEDAFTNTAQGTRIEFYTTPSGSTTRRQSMVITGAGLVGINTPTPADRFSVLGNFSASGIYSSTTASAANVWVDGNGRLYRSTSSRRYKRDIRPLPAALGAGLVDKLRPVLYRRAADVAGDDVDFVGLIAEDVAEAGGREYVSLDQDGRAEGLMYERLTAMLIGAVQDLRTRVARLEEINSWQN